MPAVSIGLLLLFTFRLYTFSYFWLDDFSSFYWARTQTFTQMLWHVINPTSDFFRPVGMFVYWIAEETFGLNPLAIHCLMWTIHAINTAIVYWILKRLTCSRAGAFVGAMLFASNHVLGDLYWNFGTIFELVGASLFFLGLLLWTTEHQSLRRVVLATVVFLLALKAKEMAITLPVIWLSYDLFVRRPLRWRKLLYLSLPALVAAWYALKKVRQMGGTDPAHPYFMDITGLTLGRGFGGYFGMLLPTDWRWQIWAITFVGALLVLVLRRNTLAAFFLSYVFLTFMPVIFLVNHREDFYWYFPLLGVCGLAALLVKQIEVFAVRFISPPLLKPLSIVVFFLLCFETYVSVQDMTLNRRIWQQGLALQYRTLVAGLQSMPAPPPGETLFFESTPEKIDGSALPYVIRTALTRDDLDARLVDTFPPGAQYRFRFENYQLIREP
jgi:hypothetical protein